jgi:hypothetical protein
MKSVWLTIVIGLALGKGVLAQAGADGTYGGMNGRGWQDLTARMRTGYIEGYIDGVSIGITQAAASQAGLISPPAVSLVAKAIGDLFSYEYDSCRGREGGGSLLCGTVESADYGLLGPRGHCAGG